MNKEKKGNSALKDLLEPVRQTPKEIILRSWSKSSISDLEYLYSKRIGIRMHFGSSLEEKK